MYENMLLMPIMSIRDFRKWGIDFEGPYKLHAWSTHAQYMIVTMDYLTKWVKAKATLKNNAHTATKFLYEFVYTCYGLPIEIVINKGVHFINNVINFLLE